jgi:redox-sensitive bicupin YhaK (pirin superfamily)
VPDYRVQSSHKYDFNTFAYVIGGKVVVDSQEVPVHHMAAFARNGDTVELAASGEGPAEILLFAGMPLGEPVARWGPFVMNTRAEIIQAVEDYQSGRMGRIER